MYACLYVHSDIECKELQLSEEQNRATKPGFSLTSSQEHHKQLRTKAIKMKTKFRAAPYPEVGLPLGIIIVFQSNQKMNVFTQLWWKMLCVLVILLKKIIS